MCIRDSIWSAPGRMSGVQARALRGLSPRFRMPSTLSALLASPSSRRQHQAVAARVSMQREQQSQSDACGRAQEQAAAVAAVAT
eukprot:5785529-Alexandrium_andersonii.AAC.1